MANLTFLMSKNGGKRKKKISINLFSFSEKKKPSLQKFTQRK
jgi:hypothetical protein